MTEARQLRSGSILPDTSITRRTKRAGVRSADDDKQRERKRALDRKAQRASREKTRSHIANLEKMVQILSENGNTATSDLLEEIERLHAEIDRLRKIIDGVRSVLGVDPMENLGVRQLPQSKPEPMEGLLEMQKEPETESIVSTTMPPDPEQSWSGSTIDGSELAEPNMGALPAISATSLSKVPATQDIGISILNWSNTWEQESMISDPSSPEVDSPLPNSLHTAIPVSEPIQYSPCKLWQKANSIYAKMFQFSKERAEMASKADVGSLFKAMKRGWGSLSLNERSNPILIILKEVDQHLFWDLDPVTKIANLYKSWLLLKYYFDTETNTLENVPLWQRPVWSQKTKQHPVPIDFFPWPALRDRLVWHHSYYFSTSEFSVHYRKGFKFSWPFSFDDTYFYNANTDTYTINPLFERYHNDERSWSMKQRFFERYPEFVGEISPYKYEDQLRRDAPAILRRFSRNICVGHEETCKESCKFTDARILALFDQYPDLI